MAKSVALDGAISVIRDQDMSVSDKRVNRLIRVVPRKQPFVPVHYQREQARKAVYIFFSRMSSCRCMRRGQPEQKEKFKWNSMNRK